MVNSNDVKNKWMIHLVKCLLSKYANQQVTLTHISVVTLSASNFSSMPVYWSFLEIEGGMRCKRSFFIDPLGSVGKII